MKFSLFSPRLCGAVLATAVMLPAAAEKWVKVTTAHFELYTPAGEKRGREAILYFEQVRDFFLKSSPSKSAPDFPVRIIAFKSEKQYIPYRPNEGTVAYYNSSDQRDYIVMQDTSSEHQPTAIHEYVHLLVRHTGVKLPMWLNEGMAEVYSTMRPLAGKVLVGSLPAGRVASLMEMKWFDLETLTRVDHQSAAYNKKELMQVFYAESWLLAHMLILGDGYREHFTDFLKALQTETSADAAMRKAYGKDISVVQRDLRNYLRSDLKGALFDQKLEKSAEQPETSDVPSDDAELVLADILIIVGKEKAAEAEFKRLAAVHPNNPDIEESLGYLAWHDKRTVETREHFRKAIAAGSKNAKMYNQFAALEMNAGQTPKEIVPVLRKALELKPGYQDAAWNLLSAAMRTEEYSVALEALGQLKNVKPDEAFRYYYSVAYAYHKMGSKEQALRFLASARKAAKDPDDADRAERLERFLKPPAELAVAVRETAVAAAAPRPPADEHSDGEAAPTRLRRRNGDGIPDELLHKVTGSATKLDCKGESARLHVNAEGRVMIFDIVDPAKVQINGNSGRTFEFTCGTQKPFPVTVEYADYPAGKAGTGTGVLRGLTLQ